MLSQFHTLYKVHVDSECELTTDNFFKSAGKESEEVKIKDAIKCYQMQEIQAETPLIMLKVRCK